MKPPIRTTHNCFTYWFTAALLLSAFPVLTLAATRDTAPTNAVGWPVLGSQGHHINYTREQLQPALQTTGAGEVTQSRSPASPAFAPARRPQQPFWQYAIYGSGVGASNIVISPDLGNGAAREILIGGSSQGYFWGNDFWHSIRRNPATGNYDDVFVSALYSGFIQRIALGNVTGDANQEIVVMLDDGSIYLYDFATKAQLAVLHTGRSGLTGLYLADLDGDGVAEIIVTTANDLFVFSGTGTLLWQVAGAGGYDVVAGQMDNDAALEIAATNGTVVDAATHTVQWSYANGFGLRVRLAPYSGKTYQQLIVAEGWNYVYSYDVATQLPRWSINTPQDIGALRIADVNNDGTPEVIIGDGQWGNVHVHDLNTQAQLWAVSNPSHGVTDVAVADVEADGVVDLLWGAGYSDTGADYLYIADTTGSHSIKWQSIDLEGPFLGPVIGDLDGDGQLEMVVCSKYSDAQYGSGRILVFDLATLSLRGISDPVVSNVAWTGVRDLKLRDLENDGRLEIVIGADYLYDGAIEIYGFDSSNTFTLKWTNTTRPSGSPFNKVEVADLDGDGTPEIIAGNDVAHTGSPGVYVYIFDYPSTSNPWQSVNLAPIFNSVDGLIVQDLDRNGSLEIAALVSTDDLYTFDGPTRQLVSLVHEPNGKFLSSRLKPSTSLILADDTGVAHFLQFKNNSYGDKFDLTLGSTLDGVSILRSGLWSGADSVLTLHTGTDYSTIAWQSPAVGSGFGGFVATDKRNGENRVFSSAQYAVMGFTYKP